MHIQTKKDNSIKQKNIDMNFNYCAPIRNKKTIIIYLRAQIFCITYLPFLLFASLNDAHIVRASDSLNNSVPDKV